MPTLTLAYWQQRARDRQIEGRAFIQGEYCAGADGGQFDCISPVDGRVLAQVASCEQADAERAVASARAAFDAGSWSRLAPAKRKAVLIRFAVLLEAHREELALLASLDMGKPFADSLAEDIPVAPRCTPCRGEATAKIYHQGART